MSKRALCLLGRGRSEASCLFLKQIENRYELRSSDKRPVASPTCSTVCGRPVADTPLSRRRGGACFLDDESSSEHLLLELHNDEFPELLVYLLYLHINWTSLCQYNMELLFIHKNRSLKCIPLPSKPRPLSAVVVIEGFNRYE